MTTKLLLALAVCSIPLASCKVGPDYAAPQTQTPAEFAAGQARSSADAKQLAQWWTTLGDLQLSVLVADALKNSPDAMEAAAKVRESRADLEAAGGILWPTANAGAGVSRVGAGSGWGRNQFRGGFDASWELDVFGGLQRTLEAAGATYEAQAEQQRAVRMTLAAEVATRYVLLKGYESRLAIVRGNLAAQTETLKLAESFFKAGLSTESPVLQARAQLAGLQSRVAPLEESVATTRNNLAALAGLQPGDKAFLPAVKLAAADPAQIIPAGLPSDLLRRRPDVRAAERALAAATAGQGVATAELFPKFSLTGSFAQSSARAGDLLDAGSRVWSVGPAVSFRLFDRSRLKARVRAADARTEQAGARYEKAVLTALSDTENALISCDRGRAQFQALTDTVAASERSVALATELFDKGLGNFLDVLVTQRALFDAREQLEASRVQQTLNVVALYKALGGGWEEPAEKKEEKK